MGYETTINYRYKVIGKDINAYKNYTPPSGNNPHSRGSSTGPGEFSLEGKIITVTQHVKRVEEGFTDKKGVYAPFEIVKAKVEGQPGEYYIWAVYYGVVKVKRVEEPVDPPDDPLEDEPGGQSEKPPGDSQNQQESEEKPEEDSDEETKRGTKIEVKEGQTAIFGIKEDEKKSSKPEEHPDKKFAINIVDKHGANLKVNTSVVFVEDGYQNAGEGEPPEGTYVRVPLTNGVGGTDKLNPAKKYRVVFDNSNSTEYKDTGEKGFALDNMRFVQSGWVYRIKKVISGVEPWLLKNSAYKHQWAVKNDDNDNKEAFHYGIFLNEDGPVSLPPKFSDNAGSLLKESFFRINRVHYFAQQVTQDGRGAPFLAAKITTPASGGEDLFSWLIYDDVNNTSEIKAEPVSIECSIGDQKSIIEIQVNDTGVGLATNKATVKKVPEIENLQWHIAAKKEGAGNEKIGIHRVFLQDSNSSEMMLGVLAKEEGSPPEIEIFLSAPLEYEMNVKLTFWKIKASERINGPKSALKAFQNTTTEQRTAHAITISPSDQSLAADKKRYKVSLPKKTLLKIMKDLGHETNVDKIGLAVIKEEGDNQGNKNITGERFLFPVIQTIVMFLPGYFGSTLTIVNGDGNLEKAWPSFSKTLGQSVSWLECDSTGRACRGVFDEYQGNDYLTVVDKILGFDVYAAKATIEKMLLDKALFPQVYLADDQSDENKIHFLKYVEIPFDWRLPMNQPSFIDSSLSGDCKTQNAHNCNQAGLESAPVPPERYEENEISEIKKHSAFKQFPFLIKVYADIVKNYNNTLSGANHYFLDKSFVIAGHSTGGMVMQGLLSIRGLQINGTDVSKLVKGAFYISVASLGVPKAEQMMLNGIEDDINKLVHPEFIRHVAANFPSSYILAPTAGYKDPLGTKYGPDARKERFDYLLRQGHYNTTSKYDLTALGDRTPLGFNTYLSCVGNEFYKFWLEGYTQEVPSYIFYFSGLPTISGIKNFEQKNTDVKLSKGMREVTSLAGATYLLENKNGIIGDLNNGVVSPLWKKYFQIVFLPYSDTTQLMKAGSEQIWHLHVKFYFDYYTYIIMINENGDLEVYRKNRANTIHASIHDIGDATIPCYSQLGLYFMLKNSHKNIKVMEEIPEEERFKPTGALDAISDFFEGKRDSIQHMSTPNLRWIWEQVHMVTSGKKVAGETVDENDCLQPLEESDSSGSSGSKSYGASEETSESHLVLYLKDANQAPLPADTEVVISDAGATHQATFILSEGGKLELIEMPAGDYIIQSVTLPA